MVLPWCVHGAGMGPWCFYEGFVVGPWCGRLVIHGGFLVLVWWVRGASMALPWWVRGELSYWQVLDGSMGPWELPTNHHDGKTTVHLSTVNNVLRHTVGTSWQWPGSA